MKDKVDIKIVKSADIDQLIVIYKDAGWWVEENDSVDPQFIQKIVENSFCFAVAIYENRLIGMGRSISDGVSDAYIQDVAVLSAYRGQGIGVMLMDAIVGYLKNRNLNWIGLISEPGAVSFYKRYGFRQMSEYIPFLLPNTKNDD
jgi:spermidine synthase